MCSNDDEVPPSLHSLPPELRIRLFEKYVTAEDLQTLRGVSTLFKFEVDQEVGLKKNVYFNDFLSLLKKQCRPIFLRSVALQDVTLDLLTEWLVDIHSILPRPSKLRHCVVGGRLRRQLLQSLFSSASNLSSLSVTGNLLPASTSTFDMLPDPQEKQSRHILQRLKSLEVSLCQSPAALEVMLTSQEVLRSIAAPMLSKFKLETKFHPCSVTHIFGTIVDVVTFIDAHPSLTSISISISFVFKGSHIPVNGSTLESRILYESVTKLLSQFKKSVQLGRFAKLEEFLLESNYEDFSAKDVADLFVEALESPGRKGAMKKLGFKTRDLPNWEKTLRTLTSYHETLREIFVESTIFSAIDFRSFGVCGNLESFSIHVTKWSAVEEEERRVGVLSNVAEGLEMLEKLQVFVVNGLVLRLGDAVALSLKPLRVLGLWEVALRDASVVPPPLGDLLDGNGGDGAFLCGIPLEALVNMLSNRNLEALLVDQDSIFVTSLQSTMNFELMKERLAEMLRSLILEISVSEDEDKSPYWKLLGSSVEFPFF